MHPVRLIAFPGAPNLPIFVAVENGLFAAEGIAVDLTTTPSSSFQIGKLIDGEFDVAGSAFDNIVAYTEGQGAVALSREPDLFAFMGATRIELAFVVAPEIESFEQLRGRTIALDALSTGFAFILYRMLENAGLGLDDVTLVPVGATPERWESVRSGTHAGTLTIEPFTSIAESQGYRVLSRSGDIFAHYQGGVFATTRRWANANGEALTGFIRGYLAGLAWTLDPANRKATGVVLLRNMPAIKPPAVERVLTNLLDERTGLTPGARVDRQGVETVLDLRSTYGGGTRLDEPDKYFDLGWYRQATS
ncbi:MAG: ABC transporter substrate-binding protein [Acetobacterales bacterium]